uniref:RING-type domain-containing protein n=1 Tax=Erythrolobus madagascarensis TaxID=708628 RepID=A0A7S0T8G6_9RHOD
MADDVAAVREKMRVLIRGEEGGRRVSSVDVKANVMQAMSRMFLLHAALRARGEMCAWMNALDSAKVKVMNEEKALLEMEMQSGKKHGTVRGEHGKKNGSDRETETSPRHAERLGTARSRLSMVLNTLDEMEWDQERFKNVPPAAQTHLLSLKRAMVRRVLFVIEARLERGTIHSRERGLAAADATAAASAASTEESSMKGTEAFGGGGGGGDGWGEDANVTCVICAESGSVLVAPCTHRCCKQCWDEWLDRSKSCPMCRRYVHPSQLVDRLRADETLTHIDRIDLTALTRKRHRPRVVF